PDCRADRVKAGAFTLQQIVSRFEGCFQSSAVLGLYFGPRLLAGDRARAAVDHQHKGTARIGPGPGRISNVTHKQEKQQYPSIARRQSPWSLEFGVFLVFGAWCLELSYGAYFRFRR